MKNEKQHLPLFGIGPILCFPMAIISAIAIYLSFKGLIPLPFKGINSGFETLGWMLMFVCGIKLIKSIEKN